MPPELHALQLKERIVSARVWRGPTWRHRYGEPDNIILSRLSPLLSCYRGVGGVLIWDCLELPVFPLEDHGALGTGLVVCLKEDISVIGGLATTCSHQPQADRTTTVLGSGPDKDELIGHAVRSWWRDHHLPAGGHLPLLMLRKFAVHFRRFSSQGVITAIEQRKSHPSPFPASFPFLSDGCRGIDVPQPWHHVL